LTTFAIPAEPYTILIPKSSPSSFAFAQDKGRGGRYFTSFRTRFDITVAKGTDFGVSATGCQISEEEGVVTHPLKSVSRDGVQEGASLINVEIASFIIG